MELVVAAVEDEGDFEHLAARDRHELFEAGAATADLTRALFWLVGAGAAGVLFFSYYLDDTGR